MKGWAYQPVIKQLAGKVLVSILKIVWNQIVFGLHILGLMLIGQCSRALGPKDMGSSGSWSSKSLMCNTELCMGWSDFSECAILLVSFLSSEYLWHKFKLSIRCCPLFWVCTWKSLGILAMEVHLNRLTDLLDCITWWTRTELGVL
jgi:hypothetical protein